MAKSGPKRDPLAGGGQSLADRVRDRVELATRSVDRRDGATRPKARRGRRGKAEVVAANDDSPTRDVRILREVFTDLGRRYRKYRERTGAPISAEIKSAAIAFKAEPSIRALVPVAGYLDELDLLDW